MELDGSNRKKLLSYIEERSSYEYLIHRGFAYYVEDMCFYSVPLDNTNKKVKVFEFSDDGIIINFALWADGGYVYVCTEYLDQPAEYYRYDISRTKCEKVWSVDSIMEDWMTKGDIVNGWYITKGVIYYYLSGNGIWIYDFSSKKYTKLASITDPSQYGYATFDDENIYIDSSNVLNPQDPSEYAIYVYDYQGVLADKIPIGDIFNEREWTYFCLVASSPDKLFGVGKTSRPIEFDFGDMSMYFSDMEIFYLPIPNGGEGMAEIKLGV